MSDLGWYDRTRYDKKQNERLDSLASEISHQRSEAGRLQARLAKVQGALEVRLNGLATAFDAFVELCDLREELRAFEPVADARHRARRVVGRLVATGASADLPVLPPAADPSPELADYWLPGAVAGLVATVQGDRAAADATLAEARERDSVRTGLFLCLAFVLSGRTGPAVELLPGLLDLQPDRPVTRAQRELWRAASTGRLGDRGPDTVVERLAALTAGLPDAMRASEAASWHRLVAGVGGDLGKFREVPAAADLSGLVAPLRAARQVEALAVWHAQAAHPAPADRPEPGEADPSDPLYVLLRELVDEGVPDEQPLLARMVELRRTIEAGGGAPAAAPPRWDAPVDTPMALLLADAGSAEAGCRAVAARAATPLLAAVADDLVVAASRPLPERIEMRIGQHLIGYTATGPDAATVDASRGVLPAAPSRDGRATRVGVAIIAVAAVLVIAGVVLAVPLAAGFGVLLALLGATSVAHAYTRRRDAEAAARTAATEWARTELRIAAIGTALGDLRAQAVQAATDAGAARARLEQQFAVEAVS